MEIVEREEEMVKKTTTTKNLAMEEYLDLFDSYNLQILTIAKLNQIISMHGFKKMKTQKMLLVDAVSTMSLMDLCRSTLQNGVVSGVGTGASSLTLDEVIMDLKDLNWQECHVTSLVNVGVSDSSDSTGCGAVSMKKRKRNRSLKKINTIAAEVRVDSSANGTTVAAESTVAVKRKRSKSLKKINTIVTEVRVDSANGTTIAAEGTVAVKRKRNKNNTIAAEVRVDSSAGAIVIAESTTGDI